MEHRSINDTKRKDRWNIVLMIICLTVLAGCAESTINNESPKADISPICFPRPGGWPGAEL